MIWAAVKAIFAKPIWRAIGGALGRVPWQIYAALALVLAFQVHGCTQYRSGFQDGKESVLSELRTAEAKSVTRSIEAARKADAAGAIRAEQQAAVIAEQIERIEQAERTGGNALDSLFN